MKSLELYTRASRGGTVLLKPEEAVDIAKKLERLEKLQEVDLYDWHDEAIRK